MNEPRVFSVKNIRDIFFTLLNTSMAQYRICDGETNINALWDKCKSLTEECERIEKKLDKTRRELDMQHEMFHREFESTQTAN